MLKNANLNKNIFLDYLRSKECNYWNKERRMGFSYTIWSQSWRGINRNNQTEISKPQVSYSIIFFINDILYKNIYRFISEEDCSDNESIPKLTDDPTWIIDPIDGTANFVRKLPITCISLGFVVKKEQTIGIIYNPFLNEMYTAIKGRGAFLNGKRIYTSKQEGKIVITMPFDKINN